MPERILRDWTDSEKFDGFQANPETLFTRLLMKVDDYGRFTRDPINVRAACFPRSEALRANTVDAWLKELSDHRLIFCYQVSGKSYLAILNFRQRLRVDAKTGNGPKPKYPPPDGKPMDFRPDDGDWRESAATSGGSPPYADANAGAYPNAESPPAFPKSSLDGGCGGRRVEDGKSKVEDGGECREIPDEEQAVAMTVNAGIDDKFVRLVFRQWSMQAGKNANGVIVGWLPYVTGRWANEQVEWRAGTHRGNRKSDRPGERERLKENLNIKTL